MRFPAKVLVVFGAAMLAVGCRESSDKVALRSENPAKYAEDPSLNAARFADFTALSIISVPAEPGHYQLRLGGKSAQINLGDIDLRPFVPRVPLIARDNAMLTAIALQQDELNRVDAMLSPQPGGVVPHLSNNCLRAGLWELYLTKPSYDGGPQEKFYHSWFEFPAAEYRRLFKENTGLRYSRYRFLLGYYEALEGLPVDLGFLRKVRTQQVIPLGQVQTHQDEPVLRLPEQQRKLKLVLTKNLRTYGDFAAQQNQPIKLAAFRPPGIYERRKPWKIDLAFLGRLREVIHREVYEPRLGKQYDEIEMDFGRGPKWKLTWSWPFVRVTRGIRLLLGGVDLSKLPVIHSAQPVDAELAHVTFGVGTPEVYPTYQLLLAESEGQPSDYLLLLDREGKYIDNHATGLDRIYLGRGTDGRIEIYGVSYEREAIVAHWTLEGVTPALQTHALGKKLFTAH